MHRPALLALFALGLLAACAATPNTPPHLEGTRWHLVEVSGRPLAVPTSPSIDLRFLDGRLHFLGCNALSGRYTQQGQNLQVPKGFVGTRMSCNDELMAIDTAATQLFEQGASLQRQGQRLLVQGTNERWVFEPATDDDPQN